MRTGFSTLQAEEPEIDLVAFCEGTRDDEGRWHEHFADKRLRGEWFALEWDDYIGLVTTLDQVREFGMEMWG